MVKLLCKKREMSSFANLMFQGAAWGPGTACYLGSLIDQSESPLKWHLITLPQAKSLQETSVSRS